jgi:hypothetical protein
VDASKYNAVDVEVSLLRNGHTVFVNLSLFNVPPFNKQEQNAKVSSVHNPFYEGAN